MTPELGAIASTESLAFVLTEAIATNTDVSKEIRDKYGDMGNWMGKWGRYLSIILVQCYY